MNRFINAVRAVGRKGSITGVAPTQHVKIAQTSTEDEPNMGKGDDDTAAKEVDLDQAQNTGIDTMAKERKLDRALDRVVAASGSQPVFMLIIAGLLVWALLGIPYGHTENWAILISNVQAIICYVYDSLLMRQQLNGYESFVSVAAGLQSRIRSQRRMIGQLKTDAKFNMQAAKQLMGNKLRQIDTELPAENVFERLTTLASKTIGHLITLGLYWMCIVVWLAFGPHCDWSDRWQLYINSATSALMVLIFGFLANLQERHQRYMKRCMQNVFVVDAEVELKLRSMTGDATPNEEVVIAAPTMGRIQRAIFYYADLVGTLTGIAILTVVLVVWVSIGPALQFDSNWWLLIGTYAGLVGLNDGFVLRNIQDRLDGYEASAFAEVRAGDEGLLAELELEDPAGEFAEVRSLSYRLSEKMGVVCAHEWTVISGVVVIIGLITGSSAMKWTVTGQLLCNIPPSIIETFFMMILVTGHNLTEAKRRHDVQSLYVRRLQLLSLVEGLEQTCQ